MRVSCTVLALACAASLWPGAAGAQIVLGLADVLGRAREQAPQIVVARLAVAEAQGRVAGASLRLQMNPELDLNAGNRQGDGTRSTDLQFGINQMFEPRARRAARIAAAGAEVDQSAVEVEEATRAVLREAARLFYQALYAGERVRLLTASADLAGSIFEVADRRFRAGDLAVLDVNLARSALARARAHGKRARPNRPRRSAACARCCASTRRSRCKAASSWRPRPTRTRWRVGGAAARAARAGSRSPRGRRRSVGGQDVPRPNYGVGLRYQREGGDNIVFGGVTFVLPVFAKGQELPATGTARGARLARHAGRGPHPRAHRAGGRAGGLPAAGGRRPRAGDRGAARPRRRRGPDRAQLRRRPDWPAGRAADSP